jgi:hypothetical protein
MPKSSFTFDKAVPVNHDFRKQPGGYEAARFLSWLEQETVQGLQRSYGDAEATKAVIFLYVNRAFEAHMLEPQVGQLFGKCIVRAGFNEEDEEPAFAWLESFAQVAARVHGETPRL